MLIRNGLVAGSSGSFERSDIRITGSRIAAVGSALAGGDGEPELDASRRLVVPGLVNAHAHSNEGYVRGLWDALPLEMWLSYAYPVSTARLPDPRAVYVRTVLAAIEQLRAGTTCVVDFLYELPNPTEATIRAVVAGYRDAGIRAVVAISMWDRPVIDVMPIDASLLPPEDAEAWNASPPAVDEWMALARSSIDATAGDETVRIGLAIDQPQRCTDELMLAIGALAHERNLAIHTHSLESRLCRYTGLWRFGVSQVEHLDRLGLLSPRLSLVHSVWVDDADIELMSRRGANVVHNPVSNLKLGSGIAPIPAFVDAGITVALGTDGESTNDARDMFEVTKLAALLQRPANPGYREWLTTEQTWRMATRGGARAANLENMTGVIEPGREADMVLLDIDDPSLVPFLDAPNQLVLDSPARAVREVFVAGRQVVRDGGVVTVDTAAIVAEASAVAAGLVHDRRAARGEGDRLRPMLDDLFRRAWAADVGMEAFTPGGPHVHRHTT